MTPVAYTPSTDFGDDEAGSVSGRSTVRTQALDAELQAIALFTQQVVSSLTAIQRADGALLDGVVTLGSLSASVLTLLTAAGGTVRGAWLTATAYAIKDVVSNGTGTYIAATAHTSGVFATDLAAGKWVKLFDSASFAASAVAFTPTGSIASANVQAALAEVDSEKMAKASNLSDVANLATARANLGVPSSAEIQAGTFLSSTNSGTADALIGVFTPAITVLTNNMLLIVECVAANTSTTPTFTPNAVLPIAPKTMVRPDGSALFVGDLPGANFKALICYDASLDKWLLINPTIQQGPPIVPVRQTVLSGPVDATTGLASFGGATGAATLTAAGTLIVSAANGFNANGAVNRIGSITNPQWTGLSTNGAMYLWLDVNADGTCTPVANTLAPAYQWGGTYSTTNGQFTFNIQEMIGKVGNGGAAVQTYRVCVGEVTVAGAVVSAITWYQPMGRYMSDDFAIAALTLVTKNHNLGVMPLAPVICQIVCISTEQGYAVGDVITIFYYETAGIGLNPSVSVTRLIARYIFSTGFGVPNAASGANVSLTFAKWKGRIRVDRGW